MPWIPDFSPKTGLHKHKLNNTAVISICYKNPTEFFKVDIGDSVELDGYCIKPPDIDYNKKHPLLYYIYGEPAGQTISMAFNACTKGILCNES